MALDPGRVKLVENACKAAVQRAIVGCLPEHWLREKRAKFKSFLAVDVTALANLYRLDKARFRFRRYHTGSVWFELKATGLEIDIHVHGKA